jgi:hypothetical protein
MINEMNERITSLPLLRDLKTSFFLANSKHDVQIFNEISKKAALKMQKRSQKIGGAARMEENRAATRPSSAVKAFLDLLDPFNTINPPCHRTSSPAPPRAKYTL